MHGFSHLAMLVLPPLFLALEQTFAVGLFELGLLIPGFNLVTALGQYTAGLMVDRFGARRCLTWGLALSIASLATMAFAPNFWVFTLAYLVCGLANTVYHPADFRLLNAYVAPERRSKAFAIHLTLGNVGFALAPALLTPMGIFWGWRAALALAAGIGALALIALTSLPRSFSTQPVAPKDAAKPMNAAPKIWRKPAVWLHLVVFTFLSVVSGGIQSYSVLAGAAAFSYSTEVLTAGLSLYLFAGGAGTLIGGGVFRRNPGAERAIFFGGLLGAAAAWCVVWLGWGGSYGFASALLMVGFATGVILPARDMLIASISTPETQGRIYGFVTTGINIGQLSAPLLLGGLIASGILQAYFAIIFAALLATLLAAGFSTRGTKLRKKETL